MYNPKTAPDALTVQAVWAELARIRNTLETMQVNHLEFQKHYSEPKKPIEGRVYYADGTSWNPGNGKGLYVYIDGWIPLATTINNIRPAPAYLNLTGLSPYVHIDVIRTQIANGNLKLTGVAPRTYINRIITSVPNGTITLTGITPSISVTP